jgi:hypothetical protein
MAMLMLLPLPLPILGRRQRERERERAPTTAELREARARDWATCFSGPSEERVYRRAFLRYSPLGWHLIVSSQGDLLRLLLGRVPAELGVPAIFGITALFGRHPKADDAALATLGTIVNELDPRHARTLLVSLADGWANAGHRPYEERGAIVSKEFSRAVVRLGSTSAEESGAISTIAALLDIDLSGERAD